jgi:hypothetical protein
MCIFTPLTPRTINNNALVIGFDKIIVVRRPHTPPVPPLHVNNTTPCPSCKLSHSAPGSIILCAFRNKFSCLSEHTIIAYIVGLFIECCYISHHRVVCVCRREMCERIIANACVRLSCCCVFCALRPRSS